jgi:hypothetical protein
LSVAAGLAVHLLSLSVVTLEVPITNITEGVLPVINPPTNQPQIDRKLTLFGLFGFSTAYAFLLSTKTGKRWADEQTWATVVGGVGLTTAFIALEDRKTAYTAFIYFFVAAIPIVYRSLSIQLEKWDSTLNSYLPK